MGGGVVRAMQGGPWKVPAGVSGHQGLWGLWTQHPSLAITHCRKTPPTAQTNQGLLRVLSQSGPGTPLWVPQRNTCCYRGPGCSDEQLMRRYSHPAVASTWLAL